MAEINASIYAAVAAGNDSLHTRPLDPYEVYEQRMHEIQCATPSWLPITVLHTGDVVHDVQLTRPCIDAGKLWCAANGMLAVSSHADKVHNFSPDCRPSRKPAIKRSHVPAAQDNMIEGLPLNSHANSWLRTPVSGQAV